MKTVVVELCSLSVAYINNDKGDGETFEEYIDRHFAHHYYQEGLRTTHSHAYGPPARPARNSTWGVKD
jgi:hypothetical protein